MKPLKRDYTWQEKEFYTTEEIRQIVVQLKGSKYGECPAIEGATCFYIEVDSCGFTVDPETKGLKWVLKNTREEQPS
jgi:hypothetical protein